MSAPSLLAAAPFNVNTPVAWLISKVAVLPVLMVKPLFVAALPLAVNCKVPPLNTRLVSALLD